MTSPSEYKQALTTTLEFLDTLQFTTKDAANILTAKHVLTTLVPVLENAEAQAARQVEELKDVPLKKETKDV